MLPNGETHSLLRESIYPRVDVAMHCVMMNLYGKPGYTADPSETAAVVSNLEDTMQSVLVILCAVCGKEVTVEVTL